MKNILFSLLAMLSISTISCVEDEMYKGPAVIETVTFTPSTVTPDDPVTVNATVKDLQGIVSAKILYSVNGGSATEVNMTGSGSNFSGIIPQQANHASVTFSVTVNNQAGFTTTSKEFSFTVGAIPPDYTQLVLNEIDGNSKAIELYNKGTKALSLEGVTLTKNNSGNWWTASAAAGKIEPGAYILIIQSNSNPEFSGASGISNKQNLKFELKDPSGNSIGVFLRGDENSLGTTISDVSPKSYQRVPNASGDWKLADPSNGSANAATGNDIPQN